MFRFIEFCDWIMKSPPPANDVNCGWWGTVKLCSLTHSERPLLFYLFIYCQDRTHGTHVIKLEIIKSLQTMSIKTLKSK